MSHRDAIKFHFMEIYDLLNGFGSGVVAMAIPVNDQNVISVSCKNPEAVPAVIVLETSKGKFELNLIARKSSPVRMQ